MLGLAFTMAFVAGHAVFPTSPAVSQTRFLSYENLVPVQYPGGGPRSGTGPHSGVRACPDRCRTVVEPGSGRGPEQKCERVEPQCQTVVTPGSGRGPEQVCSCP